MAKGLFINEDYLKTITSVAGNVDMEDLRPHINEVQDIHVQELLGSKFYTSLTNKIVNNTLSSPETALVRLIRPYQAWYVLYYALPFIHYKIKNKGLIKTTGDNIQSADVKELQFIREEIKNKAEFYGKRIQDYLCDNGDTFPDYANPDTPLAPYTGSTFSSDLFLYDEYMVGKGFTSNDIRKYLYGE